MNIEIKSIKNVSTTTELSQLAEKILSTYPADDHSYLSYGESADLIDAQAESTQDTDNAKMLREIETRWFELEA